jgi:hypothetical protein
LIGAHLLSLLARSERFTGEIDAISLVLIFGGIGVALKTVEVRLRAERDSSTD